jgi:hypothetical protein
LSRFPAFCVDLALQSKVLSNDRRSVLPAAPQGVGFRFASQSF